MSSVPQVSGPNIRYDTKWLCRSFHFSHLLLSHYSPNFKMSTENFITFCSFTGVLEIQDTEDPQAIDGSMTALLQGPPLYEAIPALIQGWEISVHIDYHNPTGQLFLPGAVILCHGLLHVQECDSKAPFLFVEASSLFWYSHPTICTFHFPLLNLTLMVAFRATQPLIHTILLRIFLMLLYLLGAW
jgi:hypothetical protein